MSGYSFADHAPQGNRFEGNYLLKPSAPVDLWSPSKAADRQTTTVRFVPGLMPDGSLVPYRSSPEPNQFGVPGTAAWLWALPVFFGGAASKVSFFAYDPVRATDEEKMHTPAAVLYSAIKRAVDAGQCNPAWNPLVIKKGKDAAPLGKIDAQFFSHGLLLEHKGKFMAAPRGLGSDRMPLIQMTGGTGRKLVNILNQKTANYSGNPADYSQSMAYGDPVSIAPGCGRFVRFCGVGGPLSARAAETGTSQYTMKINNEEAGFDIVLESHLGQNSADFLCNVPIDQIKAKLGTYENMFFFPDPQEQALALARVFPGDAIEYAFQEHPSWMSADLRAITRRAVSVGGGGPVAGYPQQPQGYPQQGFQQGYPPQGFQQGYPQGYPQQPQGYPQPGFQQPPMQQPPNYGAPQQQPQHVPGQHFQQPGDVGLPAAQGYPQQGFQQPPMQQPPQGYPQQGFQPPQGGPVSMPQGGGFDPLQQPVQGYPQQGFQQPQQGFQQPPAQHVIPQSTQPPPQGAQPWNGLNFEAPADPASRPAAGAMPPMQQPQQGFQQPPQQNFQQQPMQQPQQGFQQPPQGQPPVDPKQAALARVVGFQGGAPQQLPQ